MGQIMLETSTEAQAREGLLQIWEVMKECVQTGIRTEGVLPDGLRVRHRALELAGRLLLESDSTDPRRANGRIPQYALTVNEGTRR